MSSTNWTIPGSPTNPIMWTVGDKIPLSLQFTGASVVTVTSIACYKKGADISETAFPDGATAEDGDTVSSKPLLGIAGDADKVYIVVWTCVVDDNTEVKKSFVQVEGATTES